MASFILIALFLVLLLLGIPVALAMGITTIVVALELHLSLMVIAQRIVSGINNFPLLAIPFFIIAGELMNEAGISKKLVDFTDIFVGRIRGGLALVNVSSSMLFGGISGSALADASSIGSILIPMMRKKGYDKNYAVAVTVSGATQGIIIPPSQNMIIYALAAGGSVSIGSLFLAGIVPGILIGLSLMVTSYVIALKRHYPKEEPIHLKAAIPIALKAIPGLLTGVIIIGGIVTGVFTATESAAIGVIYAFILSFGIMRNVNFRGILRVLKNSMKTLALVLFIISVSNAYAWLLAFLQIPSRIAQALLSFTHNPTAILLIVALILLIIGTILDVAPAILITTPILLPIVTSVGMNPIQYGIMMMICLAVGLVTPPVGAALFVGSAVGKVPMEDVVKALIPFYVSMVVVLLLVVFIPSISMFVPHLLLQ